MQLVPEITERTTETPAPALRRGLTAGEVARLLGRSRSWFYAHQERLKASGFPTPNPVTGRWDRKAVDSWCDRFHGL